MNNRKINKKAINILIVIALCITVIAMNSYAFWSIIATQNETNIVGSGCLDLDFTEGDAINLGSQFPISDEDSESISSYTFTITNVCSMYASYQVNLEVLPVLGTETKLADEYVKVSLNNSNKRILIEHEGVATTITEATTSYKLTTGELAENESVSYDLRKWMDQDTPLLEGQNKSFRSKIVVIAVPFDPSFLASEPLSSPSNTSVFWGGPIGRDTIEEISFTITNEVPAGVIGSWDAGLEKDGKVMAWYTDTDANSKYEIVVGANSGVYAPENSKNLFDNFQNLKSLNLTNFNTSRTTNMYRMFASAGYSNPNFTLDLGNKFDTSNVTNMGSMFNAAGYSSTVLALDLGDKFDTSNVTNMGSIFNRLGYSNLNFMLDLGDKFDTSNVTHMQYMFYYTGYSSPVFELALGNKFDTSNVIDMTEMFYYTGYSNPNFVLDLRTFNINAVTTTNANTFLTGKTTHKLYASSSNMSFMSGKGFTGTIINCTTSPASCS